MKIDNMTKSIEIKVPHFQKDVIIPQIYDLKNIKIIQQRGYKSSPVNKVAQLKKNKIQNVIKSIVYKEKVNQTQPNVMYKSLTLNPKSKQLNRQPSYSKNIASARKQSLFMEIDEQIGQMITLADENFIPFAERVKTILGKVKHSTDDKNLRKKHQDAQFFMNVLCKGANKRINPEQIRPVSGLINEIEFMKNKETTKKNLQRAKSACLSRPKSLVKHSQNFYKQKYLNQSSNNLKQKKAFEDQLNKSRQIIKTINDCIEEESKINRNSKGRMKEMKNQWGSQGPVQQTFIRSSSLIVNTSTLDVLKEKRLKMQALNRIDNQYIKQ